MRSPSADLSFRLTFRRAFLWTLAAFALLWSLRADAAPTDEPTVRGPAVVGPAVPQPAESALPAAEPDAAPQPQPPLPESPVDAASPLAGASVTHFPEENWTVTIVPNSPGTASINGRRYNEVYAAIPYRRAEYLADPGYRHEATLEVLFGQLRPKTVVSNYTPQVVPTPRFSVYKPYRYSQTDLQRFWPYSFRSLGFGLSPYYPAYPLYPMLY